MTLARLLPQALRVALACTAGCAQAHGFDERYDLPVPLGQVVAGACAVVALSFIAAALFARRSAAASAAKYVLELRPPKALLKCSRGLAWLLFALTIAAALWGSRDPLMNLAPTLVWIVWWVGLSFASAVVGQLWPALDPWRTSFEILNALARRLGRPRGIHLGWRWPPALGMWPAVALLLAWAWLEVVMPLASTPFKLGIAALLWTAVSLAGMAAFGRAAWQAHADVFAIVFSTLGRMAPLRLRIDPDTPVQATAGQVAFVMAMLATVVFDGLHGGAAWNSFEGLLRKQVPQWLDTNGLVAGTLGLLVVWLLFWLAYSATLRLSLAAMRPALTPATIARLAAQLAISLVPIALAYNVAHNFSSVVLRGQTVFQLLSDPFGLQWDLFGTARWYPDIGLVDAKLTWFVAVTAIVLGHALSIWWSHRLVLAAGVPQRQAARAMLPLTLLMLAYTAISLLLIAEPMVQSPG